MKTVDIKFTVRIPDIEHTEKELVEWLRYQMGDDGQISLKNPLEKYDITPIFGTFKYTFRK